ncbi:MAG: PIN domain-containing protein [Thermoguttaceae bacterium]|jgi:predicted nucleic acid-binding protein
MIVLDTSILSLALRRPRRDAGDEPPLVAALRRLVADDAPLAVPGIVLQELLSGVRSAEQFDRLQGAMAGFPVLLADKAEHLRAARIGNACRGHGIACSTIDALIAAQTIERNASLFTTDVDFKRIAACSDLKLMSFRQEKGG